MTFVVLLAQTIIWIVVFFVLREKFEQFLLRQLYAREIERCSWPPRVGRFHPRRPLFHQRCAPFDARTLPGTLIRPDSSFILIWQFDASRSSNIQDKVLICRSKELFVLLERSHCSCDWSRIITPTGTYYAMLNDFEFVEEVPTPMIEGTRPE